MSKLSFFKGEISDFGYVDGVGHILEDGSIIVDVGDADLHRNAQTLEITRIQSN